MKFRGIRSFPSLRKVAPSLPGVKKQCPIFLRWMDSCDHFLYNEMKLYDKRLFWMKHLDVKSSNCPMVTAKRPDTKSPITGRKVNWITRSFRYSHGLSLVLISYIRLKFEPLKKLKNFGGTYSSLERLLDFGQLQTWRIHRAICTSCFITLMIQGCSSISFGGGRVTESTMSLKNTFSICKAFWEVTNVWDIKSFISSDHRTPGSSSSRGG